MSEDRFYLVVCFMTLLVLLYEPTEFVTLGFCYFLPWGIGFAANFVEGLGGRDG